VSDPILAEEHRCMLPPPRQKGQDPIDVPLLIALARIDEAETGVSAWNTMSREERAASLGNAEAFDRLLALPLT
jgi:membrane glycosyltransferase